MTTSHIHNALLLVAALSIVASGRAAAQDTQRMRDSLRAQIEQRKAEISRSAEQFFDGQLSTADRLKAVAGLSEFQTLDQATRAAQIGFDRAAPLELRVRALRLGAALFQSDSAAQRQLLALLGDSGTPVELRAEGLRVLHLAQFAGPIRGADSLLRVMTRDPNPRIKGAAISQLAVKGDTSAQAALIEGLQDSSRAALQEDVALALLSLHPTPRARAAAVEVMNSRSDQRVKESAARVAFDSRHNQQQLLRTVSDTRATTGVRVIAIQGLAAQDPALLARSADTVLSNESESDSVRVAIIEALHLRAIDLPAAAGTNLEATLRRLLSETRSAAVRDAAARYLAEREGTE
jgi:HEAT repeats